MEIKLAYGIYSGKIVHISKIPEEKRGEKCNCYCPTCKGLLSAKLGNGGRRPHFAHINVEKCDLLHAQQTGLHLFAKKVIADNNQLLLPGWEISDTDICPCSFELNIGQYIPIEPTSYETKRYEYSSVELEKRYDSIVADAVVFINNRPCIVEIAVTHFVDEKKRKIIEHLDLPVIEIDLSDLIGKDLTSDEITNAVLYDKNNRKWIHNPKRERLLKDKQEQFQKVCDSYSDKKEDTKGVGAILRRIGFRQMFLTENYRREIVKIRSDEQAKKWLHKYSFAQDDLKEYPFYMDIPITGEMVITCDRRVWQGKLFDVYVSRCFGKQDCSFSINSINNYIYNGKYIFRIDEKKEYAESIILGNNIRQIVLPYDVIKKYFQYLELLGFVKHKSFSFKDWSAKKAVSLIPPKTEEAEVLKRVLATVDVFNPNIDYIVKERLLDELPESAKNLVKVW